MCMDLVRTIRSLLSISLVTTKIVNYRLLFDKFKIITHEKFAYTTFVSNWQVIHNVCCMRITCECIEEEKTQMYTPHNNNDLPKDLLVVKLIQSLFSQFNSTQRHTHTHTTTQTHRFKCQIDTQCILLYFSRTLNAFIVYLFYMVTVVILFYFIFR